MSGPRVVVVGAGVFGLSTAVELGLAGVARVTVIDRRYPGAGSTGLSAGVFTTQYLTAEDVEVRAWSMRRITELEHERGLTLRRIGLIRLSRDAGTTRMYERSVDIQHDHGLEASRLLDREEALALLPHYRGEGVESALYSPMDGYLDGSELCSVLADHAAELGVQLMSGASVTGLRRSDGPSRYLVTTNRGELPADIICNCAGAWAGQVGDALGAPVSVVNERHEAFIFEKPADLKTIYPVMLDNVPGKDADGAALYIRAEGTTQLVGGLHSNSILGDPVEDPDLCFGGVTQDAVEDIVERVAAAFPTLDALRYRSGWAGLYPHSPDQQPVAGPHPDNEDILVGGGLGGIGLSLGPALGRTLAEWVANGEPQTFDAAPGFAPRAAFQTPQREP